MEMNIKTVTDLSIATSKRSYIWTAPAVLEISSSYVTVYFKDEQNEERTLMINSEAVIDIAYKYKSTVGTWKPVGGKNHD